jgi:sulfoquinovosidase
LEEGATTRRLYVPGGDTWQDLWSGKRVEAGWHEVEAPLGRPPLLIRDGSAFAGLFGRIEQELEGR